MLVGMFTVPLAFAFVAGSVTFAVGYCLSSSKLVKLGGGIVAGTLIVAFILDLTDKDALTPILEGLGR